MASVAILSTAYLPEQSASREDSLIDAIKIWLMVPFEAESAYAASRKIGMICRKAAYPPSKTTVFASLVDIYCSICHMFEI